MDNNIIICSWERACKLISESKNNLKHIISIGEPKTSTWYDAPPTGFDDSGAKKLRLEFHDLEYQPNSPQWEAPKEKHVKQIIEFVKNIDEGPVLFHCAAGISRSSAACLIYLYTQLKDEDKSIKKLFEIKDDVDPNMLMLMYADVLLDSNLCDKLVEYQEKRAIEKWS